MAHQNELSTYPNGLLTYPSETMSYHKELETVYTQIHTSAFINSLLGIAVFIGLILVIKKIYSTYDNYQDQKDYKLFFKLSKDYILIILFISIFPMSVYYIERVLAIIQDNIRELIDPSVEQTATQMLAEEVQKYVDDNSDFSSAETTVSSIGNALNPLGPVIEAANLGLNTLFLGITKYLYFIFSLGRYLYLLLLELFAPVAMVCVLDKETRPTFHTWLKNMLFCYMLIPAFLIADLMAELSIKALCAAGHPLFNYSESGMIAVIATFILKLSLYATAGRVIYKTI